MAAGCYKSQGSLFADSAAAAAATDDDDDDDDYDIYDWELRSSGSLRSE